MRDKNPNRKNAFQYALGKIYTISTEVENCVNRAINVNLDSCKLLAHLNGTVHLCSETKYVNMHLQGNYSSLLPSEYVSLHMDLEANENTIYCSQGGKLWHKLRKK